MSEINKNEQELVGDNHATVKKKSHAKKKGSIGNTILIIILALILVAVIICGIVAGVAYAKYNALFYDGSVKIEERKTQYEEPEAIRKEDMNFLMTDVPAKKNGDIQIDTSSDDLLSVYPNDVVEQIPSSDQFPIYKVEPINDDITDMLIISSSEKGEHIDSLTVVSYNEKSDAIKTVSLLPDALVAIEGYEWNKLSAAYKIGGIGLLINTINQNYGLDIQKYATVDAYDLVGLVDGIGGITVELSQAEIDGCDLRDVSAGICVLTGENIQKYATKETTDEACPDRATRQKKLTSSAFSNILKSKDGITNTVSNLLSERYISVNLKFTEMTDYASKLSESFSETNFSKIDFTKYDIIECAGNKCDYVVYKNSITAVLIDNNTVKAEMQNIINGIGI